ncbi:Anaerobic selenocysteine-containing dehydrogenase [Desulfuromusa kysingii]|uniref:Anaerobic selenocysteine-containing dehydrogenase n=1 Tax=Desulfuromusa kysingii TaxID=37625 RepID=A0A1H4A3G1_9BACT|nr:molybdopterin-dependent oxidoreductase [Desulfuromusa kysingii]SEA30062.1 Anaerobic selenocysteine-containing dehydrogenase [Desulfuromusa kysingii]
MNGFEKQQWVKTNCRLCGYLCGLLAQVANGRVVAIKPDPSRYPYNEKIVLSCQRCAHNMELLDHPQRMNYPLKRVGERGSGEWERVSWGDALDDIAARLTKLKEDFGAETLATSIGGPHSVYWPLHRFLNLFGSPNNLGIGQICWNPAIWINSLTFGWPLENELDPESTQCAIVWGMNPAESDNSLFWTTILNFVRSGGKLIVVDPRKTRTAEKSHFWLALKPCTDAVLALGLIHVIIAEDWVDHDFVERWCSGYAELAEQAKAYPPDYVAEITGLDVEQIRLTAQLYATGKASSILSGRGIDQIGENSIATHRAIACLRALTGNIGLSGASHLAEMPNFIAEADLEMNEALPAQQWQKKLGSKNLLLQTDAGFELLKRETLKQGRKLPKNYMTSVHPDLLWNAIITNRPYPVKAMVVMGSNPLSTQADSVKVESALRSLDLLVVLELYQSPTSLLADYILPIAGGLEKSVQQTNAGTANIVYGGQGAVAPYYERRTDYDFWRGLAVRLGQEEFWPWETFDEALDYTLEPLQTSWHDLSETGIYCSQTASRRFDETDSESGKAVGFATPSGKIELYSQLLDRIGYDPLPCPRELPKKDLEYPLILISGARFQPYYASSYRHVESMRRKHPYPLLEVSPETAGELGLTEGEVIWLETSRGRALFKLHLTAMCSGIVSAEYGWWYPELVEISFAQSYRLSNINALIGADFTDCEKLLGQWQFNGLPCRLSPANEEETLLLRQCCHP